MREPKVLCLLVDGVEEIEVVTPIDLLRRASVEVVIAGLDQLEVKGKHGIGISADTLLTQIDPSDYDMLFLPGGPGVMQLLSDGRAIGLAQDFASSDKWICAICAAPLILNQAGLLKGKTFTCHYSVYDQLPKANCSESLCIDGKIITVNAAAGAVKFGLKMVEVLKGLAVTKAVAEEIML